MISMESVLKSVPQFKGAYIGNSWSTPRQKSGGFSVVSPANLEWTLEEVSYDFSWVDEAVQRARSAFFPWKQADLQRRVDWVRKFGEELLKRQEKIGRLISLETGKPLEEGLAEAGLLKAKIDVTIDEALPLVAVRKLDLGKAGLGEIHWQPKGVLVCIGPFNFPVHLSNGHIIPALLTGNCVILKPSEKAPYCAQVYMEAAEAAGLPPGVLQLVQGNHEVASRLIRHSGVDGVLATCSYEVGAKIQKELAEQPEKIVALEMGGKNGAIVWEGAKLDQVADDLIRSAFLTTGQRCTALSRVYVLPSLLEELVSRVHDRSKGLMIHQPFEDQPKPFMGPIISAAAKERFLRYSQIAESEGAEVVMRPKELEGTPRQSRKPLPSGHYVTPGLHLVKKWDAKSPYQTHEIFGPDLFFCPVSSIDDAVAAVNSVQYGLSFSFFGGDERLFHSISDQVETGLSYWNRPTVGASARLPFGGWKRSGNHRPAGIFAIYASNQVQARIL